MGAGTLIPPGAVVGAVAVASVATAAQIAKAAAAIVAGFVSFNAKRKPLLRQQIIDTIGRLYPERTPEEVLELVRDEMAREVEFQRKQQERLERDIPDALKITDPGKRQERMDAVLARERRWEQMREAEAVRRSSTLAGFLSTRDESPQGAFWRLDPSVKTHTPLCVLFGNKPWPWSVLKKVHPLLHAGCHCSLLPYSEAIRLGYMTADQVPDEKDALQRASDITQGWTKLEEVATGEEIAEYIAEIMESPWHARFPRGTKQGGEFMPKGGRGEPVGRKLVRDALVRLLPHRPVTPAEGRRLGAGEWKILDGTHVFIPRDRKFTRTIAGRTYTSPPGSTTVTASVSEPHRAPEIPASHGHLIRSTSAAQRSEWRAEAERAARAALEAHDQGVLPAVVGAHSKSTHGGILDAGFVPYRMRATEEHDVRTYRHPASGAQAEVGYRRSGSHGVGFVNWTPGDPPASLSVPLRRPPSGWDEFAKDVRDIAHAVAAENGRQSDMQRVAVDPSLHDQDGEHGWDGVTTLGPGVRSAVESLAKSIETGEPLRHTELRSVYGAYRTALHEALHSAAPNRQSLYSMPVHRGIEEALTEELSSILTADVLRRQGLHDVLGFVKGNPTDPSVEGDYSIYRHAVGKVLAHAGVAPEQMHSVLHHLKFEVQPEDRPDVLASMMSDATGEDHASGLRSLRNIFVPAVAATEKDERQVFAPLIRPDLSDIREPDPVRVGGSEVFPGSWLSVKQRRGPDRVGRVQAIRSHRDPPTFDVEFHDGVRRNLAASEIASARPGPGREPIGHAVNVGGELLVPGDRVSWASGEGRTSGTLDRVARASNPAMAEPERGWQIEATTDGGTPVVLTEQRARGLRREAALGEAANDSEWFGENDPVRCHYCAKAASRRVVRSEAQVSVAVCAGHVETAKDSAGDEVRDLDPWETKFLAGTKVFNEKGGSKPLPKEYGDDANRPLAGGESGDVVEAADEMVAPGTTCAVCGSPATHVASGESHDVYACPNKAHQDYAGQLAGVKAAPLPIDAGPPQSGVQLGGSFAPIAEGVFDEVEHPRDRLGKWAKKAGQLHDSSYHAEGRRGAYRIEKTGKVWSARKNERALGSALSLASAKDMVAEHDEGRWSRDRHELLRGMFLPVPTAHAHEVWGGDPRHLNAEEYAAARENILRMHGELPEAQTAMRNGVSSMLARAGQDRAKAAADSPESDGVSFEGNWAANPARKKEVEETIDMLLSRYDVPLKKVEVRQAEEFDQLAGKSNTAIFLSPRFLDDEFMAKHMSQWGKVSVTTDVRDIVTHEFGHIVDGVIMRDHPAIYARLNKWLDEEVESSVGKLPRLRQGLEAPSAYGSENRYEFFAEGFADWVLRGEDAHPSSQFIGRLADEAVGRESAPSVEPIDVKGDVALAAKLLGEGKHVILDQPHQVSTLLDKLSEIVKESIAKGEQAPLFDLCKVSVKGTNLFCAQSKGIPRIEMPQLKGEPTPGSKAAGLPLDAKGRASLDQEFIAHLRAQGIGVEKVTQKASFLRASQHELNGANVARIAAEFEAGRAMQPLFVSRDDYIVDGHHTWAATVGADSRDGKLDVEMPVQRIDMLITEVLEEARVFAAEWGIAGQGVHSS